MFHHSVTLTLQKLLQKITEWPIVRPEYMHVALFVYWWVSDCWRKKIIFDTWNIDEIRPPAPLGNVPVPTLQLDVMVNWFPRNSFTLVLRLFFHDRTTSSRDSKHRNVFCLLFSVVHFFLLAKPEGSGLHQGASGHPGRSPAPPNGRAENYNPHGVSHPTWLPTWLTRPTRDTDADDEFKESESEKSDSWWRHAPC